MRGTVAAVMASLLVATPVLAQPTTPSDKQKQAAGDLVKKAIAKSQAGNHQDAIDLYKQAYDLIPAPPYGPPLLTNIGNEYLALDKPVEALKAFCQYLDADANGGMADFARAQAKVTQDKLGNHDVAPADVCKPKVEPPPPPEPVVVQPPPPLVPAEHHLSKLQLAGVAVGAAGLVSLVVGVYFGKLARDDSNTITNHDPATMWPDNIQSIEADGQSHENKQIAFLITGGVLVGAGAVMYVLGRHTSSNATEVSIAPTKGGAAFSLGGRF